MTWNPTIRWNTPAGRLLDQLLANLPEGTDLVVFGSAPLQMTLDPSFLSHDVDVFTQADTNALEEIVKQQRLGKGVVDPGIEVNEPSVFRATPHWPLRAHTEPRKGQRVIFPHPHDILIGKLHRLEPKDIDAFQLVRKRTGHPVEQELRSDLQQAVDLFKPVHYDEEQAGRFANNVRVLWPILFGHDIDPRAEIIIPALARRRKNESRDAPDYRKTAKEIVDKLLDEC